MDHRIHQTISHPITYTQKQIQKQRAATNSISFKQHFHEAITKNEKLVISKHAQKRLDERNIVLDNQLLAKIADKVKEAKQKGVTDSLVITKDAALVISAKNNTVITAMDRSEATSQIFTNINGTIVLE